MSRAPLLRLLDHTAEHRATIWLASSASVLTQLVDLATPALRELSPAQYRNFRANVTALVEADEKIELFEWVLHRMILRHLEPQFEDVKPTRVQY